MYASATFNEGKSNCLTGSIWSQLQPFVTVPTEYYILWRCNGECQRWHGNRCYGKLNRIFALYRPLKFFPEDIFQLLTEWCWNWNWLNVVPFHVLIFRSLCFWMLVYAMIWMEDRILKLFLEFLNIKYELFVINKWVL